VPSAANDRTGLIGGHVTSTPQPSAPASSGSSARDPLGPSWLFGLFCVIQAIVYCILAVAWFFWTFADAGGDAPRPSNSHELAVQTNITIGVIALLVAAAIGIAAWLARHRDIARFEFIVIVLIVAVTVYFSATTPLMG
jgi:hypothetical protein